MDTCQRQVPWRAGGGGAGRAARGDATVEVLTWSTPRGPGPRAVPAAARAIFRGRAGPDSEHQSTMSRASNASPKSRKIAKILGKVAGALCYILYCRDYHIIAI